MIIEVKQTKSAGSNNFDVISDGSVIYRGSASWFPIGADKTNKVVLTDLDGNVLYQTKYSLIDNLAESSVPFKYLFKGEQRFGQYQVLDQSGNEIGAFYDLRMSVLDSRLCLSFGNKIIYGYKREMGYREVVSFYENDVQIGQLTRTNKVVDNLDWYFAHFLPAYDALLPLIAMYVVFYDFCHHNNSGQYFKGVSVNISYTYDIHQKKYNKDFISKNFGEQENQRLDDFVNRKGDYYVKAPGMKKTWLLFAAAWLIPLLWIGIIFLILWLNGYL